MAATGMEALAEKSVREFLALGRVAHLATASGDGEPHNIPLCYWFDNESFYFVIDEKPKRRTGHQLKRMRNIAENQRVALIVDQYEEHWEQLAFVLVHGTAHVVDDREEYMLALRNLRDKYPQYRSMALTPEANLMVRIDPVRVHRWGSRFGAGQSAS